MNTQLRGITFFALMFSLDFIWIIFYAFCIRFPELPYIFSLASTSLKVIRVLHSLSIHRLWWVNFMLNLSQLILKTGWGGGSLILLLYDLRYSDLMALFNPYFIIFPLVFLYQYSISFLTQTLLTFSLFIKIIVSTFGRFRLLFDSPHF